MRRFLVAAALLSSACLSAQPLLPWVSGKVIRVERTGQDYYYSVYGGGCGYVGRTAKKLRVEPDADVKFSIDGSFLLIIDGTGKVQRTKFWKTWLAPPAPARPTDTDDTVEAVVVVDVERQVVVLIEKMLDARTEQDAFRDLEALGCPAVSAIIRHMDDWRTLPDRTIALRNKSPNAFEAARFYTPAKVVDAVAAILNQITGRSFGFIYNGGTDSERASAVRGWSEFLRRAPKLCEL
ncbi:MAG: hypothetical protein NTY38_00895 [Acidobacteria bacterium]|nr:hypothetical protein [Acidobacteriota bacterium]